MDYLQDFILSIALVIWGVILENVVQKVYFSQTKKKFKTNHFYFSRYVYLLIFPLIACVVMYFKSGMQLFYVFTSFAFVGTIIEWLIGYFYQQIVGQRLWTYHRMSLSGYTSWLCIPLWGMAGVLFWLLARVFA